MLNPKKYQIEFVEKIMSQYKKGLKIFFYEAGTGTGKTYVMLETALRILKESKKPVVIACSNNTLVAQIFKDSGELSKFQNLAKNKDFFVPLIGMSNYVAPARLENYLDTFTLKDSLTEEEKAFIYHAKKWLKEGLEGKHSGLYFSLENYLNNLEIDFEDSLKDNICLNYSYLNNKSKIKDFLEQEKVFFLRALQKFEGGNKVIITNHHNILLPFFGRVSPLSKYIDDIEFVFIDEAHTLIDAANLIYNYRFSPFVMKSCCGYIIDNKDKWENVKNARKISGMLNKLYASLRLKDYIHLPLRGEVEILSLMQKQNPKRYEYHLAWLKEIVDTLKSLKALENMYLEVKDNELKKKIASLLLEINEAQNIFNFMSKKIESFVYVSYSSKRAFPSYIGRNQNGYFALKNKFWPNIKFKTALLSGTFFLTKDDTNILQEIGIKDIGKLNKKSFGQWFYIVKTNLDKKQLMEVVLPEESKTEKLLPYNPKQDESVYQRWMENLAEEINCIYMQRPYKTLVLLGSYKDSAYLGQLLQEKFKLLQGKTLFYCEEGKSILKTIKNFSKQNKGILIGIKSFWTGYDLPNLVNLIIARLPFDSFSNLRWAEFKNWAILNGLKDNVWMPKYIWHVCQTFRQGVGRLVRVGNFDLPVIPRCYILDARVNLPDFFLYNFKNKFGLNGKEDLIRLAYGEKVAN